MNIQSWSPLEWTDWISLQSKGLSKVFSNTTVQKHEFFSAQLSVLFVGNGMYTAQLKEAKFIMVIAQMKLEKDSSSSSTDSLCDLGQST